jgi:uncharacterized protein (DUF2132 family)
MVDEHPQDLLHGMTLKAILEDLLVRHEWSGLAERTSLRCFAQDPSISSSLKFLRKTDWARRKVERLYIEDHRVMERNAKRNRRRAAMRAHRAEQDAAGESAPEERDS